MLQLLFMLQVAMLNALSAAVAVLDDVDDEVLRLCTLATNRIVTGWIYFWPKQYPAAQQAIVRLLAALEGRQQALQLVVQRLADTMLAKTLAEPDSTVASGEQPPSVMLRAPKCSAEICLSQALILRAFAFHAGPTVVAEGDRKQNWEFYRHLWAALLMAADSQGDHMDIGEDA